MSTTPPAKRVAIANAFGTLGYMSAVFQWAWALLLLCYPLLTDRPELFLPSTPSPSVPPIEVTPGLAPVVTIIAVAATILILVLTVIVIARLPRAVGKKAAVLTKKTASTAIPIITHHKKISQKQRKKLSYKLSLGIKALIVTLPLGLLLFVDFGGTIPPLATWTVGLFCAACSLVYFGVQQLIALVGSIDRDQLW